MNEKFSIFCEVVSKTQVLFLRLSISHIQPKPLRFIVIGMVSDFIKTDSKQEGKLNGYEVRSLYWCNVGYKSGWR